MRSPLRSIYVCGTALLAGITFASANGTAATPATAPIVPEAAVQTCSDRGKQRILVAVFFSKTDSLGAKVADSLRRGFLLRSCRTYFTIDGANIREILRQADIEEQKLSRGDIKLLGQQTAADIIVFGDAVSKGGRDMEVTPMLMATFDEKIVQPLPPQSEFRFTQLSRKIEAVVLDAAKQIPGLTACRAGLNEKKYEDAAKAAHQAIAAYPDATMARICLAQALEFQNAAPDSILKVVGFVLEKNKQDYWSLRFSERAERTKGNVDKANDHLLTLLAMNPTDADIQEQLIRRLQEAGNTERALQVAAQSRQDNPGQSNIINLEATICFAARKYECAISAYEDLGRIDTSAVNVPYYERLVRSYRETQKLQEAANAARRGISKFPTEVRMHLFLVQMLRELGDTAGSIAAAKEALKIDSTQIDIYIQIAGSMGSAPADSLISFIKSAVPHAKSQPDSANLHNFVLAAGQKNFGEGNSTPDSLKTDEHWAKLTTSLKLFEFAHSIIPDSLDKFFLAANHLVLGGKALNAAIRFQDPTGKVKDTDRKTVCDLSTEAYDRAVKAQAFIQDGGGRARGPTQENIRNVYASSNQIQTAAGQLKSATCN